MDQEAQRSAHKNTPHNPNQTAQPPVVPQIQPPSTATSVVAENVHNDLPDSKPAPCCKPQNMDQAKWGMTNWFALFELGLAIVAAIILYRQTRIMDRQTKIMEASRTESVLSSQTTALQQTANATSDSVQVLRESKRPWMTITSQDQKVGGNTLPTVFSAGQHMDAKIWMGNVGESPARLKGFFLKDLVRRVLWGQKSTMGSGRVLWGQGRVLWGQIFNLESSSTPSRKSTMGSRVLWGQIFNLESSSTPSRT